MAVYFKSSFDDWFNGRLMNGVSGLICELSPDYARDGNSDERELLKFCELMREHFVAQSLYYYTEMDAYSCVSRSMGLWRILKKKIDKVSQVSIYPISSIELLENAKMYGFCEFSMEQLYIVIKLMLETPTLSYAIIKEKGKIRDVAGLLSMRVCPLYVKDINTLLSNDMPILFSILGNDGISLCCLTHFRTRLSHHITETIGFSETSHE